MGTNHNVRVSIRSPQVIDQASAEFCFEMRGKNNFGYATSITMTGIPVSTTNAGNVLLPHQKILLHQEQSTEAYSIGGLNDEGLRYLRDYLNRNQLSGALTEIDIQCNEATNEVMASFLQAIPQNTRSANLDHSRNCNLGIFTRLVQTCNARPELDISFSCIDFGINGGRATFNPKLDREHLMSALLGAQFSGQLHISATNLSADDLQTVFDHYALTPAQLIFYDTNHLVAEVSGTWYSTIQNRGKLSIVLDNKSFGPSNDLTTPKSYISGIYCNDFTATSKTLSFNPGISKEKLMKTLHSTPPASATITIPSNDLSLGDFISILEHFAHTPAQLVFNDARNLGPEIMADWFKAMRGNDRLAVSVNGAQFNIEENTSYPMLAAEIKDMIKNNGRKFRGEKEL